MKSFLKKLSQILRTIFGYGIVICLFTGGITFFGYITALCLGGNTASLICEFIYKTFFPILIKASTILMLLGIVAMYLSGESSLKMSGKKKQG